ncbi:Centromere protein C/Mif2/cnp3 protein [Dioscorea alata]|uniref:Centromere protein C/Mif2/cnp3 protein n=1 Tax=Dioscorea alata TaxID=55571 RepID=A0ACB7WFM4_DIOAL|nr:Centromere protein C/Mif2/cnp3 protein [Dioscorea alata]
MALQLEHSDVEDPFTDSSIFSLLPRTLGITPVELADASKTHEPDSFQSFIKSLKIKGSKELLDQAQEIKKTSSSILSLYSDGDMATVENGKGQPQVRRLALGRKRAQFSLKSNSRAPLASIDVNSSIDHIEDPEEYFLAFEKLENAGKELKKLRGDVPTELAQNFSSPATRNRRPGILGKTASYKHHFPSQNDAVLAPSHDEISDRTLSRSSRISDNTVLDSVAEKEKNVDHILDELLSSFKDVDGNEEVSFLREKLQIKSIDVGKISLPEIASFKTKDSGVVKNISRKAEGSLQGMSSPILLSSPLAAISILQRRIPLKCLKRDHYSIHLSDNIEYAGGSSLIGGQGQPHSPVGIDHSDISGSISDIASTPVQPSDKRQKTNKKLPAFSGEMNVGKKTASEESLTGNNPLVLERDTASPPKEFVIDDDIMPAELDSCLQEEGTNVTMDAALPGQPDATLPELSDAALPEQSDAALSGQPDAAMPELSDAELPEQSDAALPELSDAGLPEQSEPGHEGPTSERPSKNGTDCLAEHPGPSFGESADASPSRHDYASQDEVNDVAGVAPVSSTPQGPEENLTDAQATILPTDERSEDSRAISEENNEEQDLQANSETLNRGTKRKAHSPKRKKPNPASKRYSLAGAGTTWNAGLRRSTRIKSRPLEYWCGERFIYGRVHDSLATVIGVKYASPSDSKLKVKSFVAEEYADLVAKAALY